MLIIKSPINQFKKNKIALINYLNGWDLYLKSIKNNKIAKKNYKKNIRTFRNQNNIRMIKMIRIIKIKTIKNQ